MRRENGHGGPATADGRAATPLEVYEALVHAGTLRFDAAQKAAVDRLDRLAAELNRPPKTGFLARIFGRNRDEAVPRGVYLWGSVGRGKTLMMDLFFEAAHGVSKRRAHFHAFMDDVHARVHELRQAMKEGTRPAGDPIPVVAEALAAEAKLLCFDEFQVTDIADAMILGRLFDRLFAAGTVVVATSNTPPSDLYSGGLNRDLFLPFIDRLEERLDVVAVESPNDYRRRALRSARLWFSPLGPEAEAGMDRLWADFTDGATGAPVDLKVKGRTLAVPCAAGRVARFTFEDLCQKPLGPADFLKIAERFDVVMIDRIPVLEGQRNLARRLIWLVDALYDQGVRLAASAEAEPDRLYLTGDFAGEFLRTASRLVEMRSLDYLERTEARSSAASLPGAGPA